MVREKVRKIARLHKKELTSMCEFQKFIFFDFFNSNSHSDPFLSCDRGVR
jgi:hypothetical protein